MILFRQARAVGIALLSIWAVGCASPAPVSPEPTVTPIPATSTRPPSTKTPPTETATPSPTPFPAGSAPPMIDPEQAVLPEGALLRQGIGLVFDSALNPERTRLALGTATGVYVYSVPDLTPFWHSRTDFPVKAVRWSPDGLRLLTGFDTYAPPELWWSDGRFIKRLDGFITPEWSPGGTMIAAPYRDLSQPEGQPADRTGIRLYDGKTGEFLRDLKVSQEFSFDATGYNIKWSPEGTEVSIRAGGWSNLRHTWDAMTGKFIGSQSAGNESFNSHELENEGYSPGYEMKAIRDWTHHKILIDAQGTELGTFLTGIPAYTSGNFPQAYWMADKRLLVVEDSAVSLITTAAHVERSFGTALPWVTRIRWVSPDRVELFQTCYLYPMTCTGNRFILDTITNTLTPQGQFQPEDLPPSELFPEDTSLRATGLYPASRTGNTVTISRSSGVMTVTRADGSTFSIDRDSLPHGSMFRRYGWSPDGESLLLLGDSGWDIDAPFAPSSASGNGVFAVWNMQTEKLTAYSDFDSGTSIAAWSPDSHTVAVSLASTAIEQGGGLEDCRIILFDAATGAQLMVLKGHTGGAFSLAWSPDGTRLISASDDGTLIVWDVSKIASRQ